MRWVTIIEKLVDLVAPSSFPDLLFKAFLLVGCFTAFDYVVGSITADLTAQSTPLALAITFMIGAPFGIFVMAVMATQSSLKNKLRYFSETDVLTGLLNRRTFMKQASTALDQHDCVAVLMIDVDHFKSVNDSYGHYIGDITLQAVGAHLRENTRNGTDIVGRVGGEEFAILIPTNDKLAAARVAAQICQKISVVPTGDVRQPFETFHVTLSVGAVMSLPGHQLVDLMCFADNALYGAKASGRDRVEFHKMADQGGGCDVRAFRNIGQGRIAR